MKDLNEIVEVDPTADFWDNDFVFNFQNWSEGTQGLCDLKEIIEDYFVK